ncbi:MAG TPA: Hsp70 family protein [Mycobacterium sp.]|nr:Hsp70 family protein [Mycobacterium sp.]
MNADADESALVITDFVDRVGAPEPVMAFDGSAHRSEKLLADGLHALAYIATEGRPLPPAVAVTHPAHWSATAVEALGGALSWVPEWSRNPVLLISDVAAVLTALQANPGLPANGIIAVCDFGGSGSSITLVDAARGHQPVDVTVRHTGFSGDLIDQALLNHVLADLGAGGSLEGGSAIGSLAGLRGQCRNVKEQLSAASVTELHVDLPGFHGGVWVTRAELDEAIREPFHGFLDVVQKTLERNQIQATDLAAVVSVGGGANIPAVTTELGQRYGVTVISSPRPHLTAAIGAALRVAGGPVRAAMAPVPTTGPPVTTTPAAAMTPSAWPETPPTWPETGPAKMAPPQPAAEYEPVLDEAGDGQAPWYRRQVAVILGAALITLVVGTVAVIALRHAAGSEPTTPTITTELTTTTSELPPPPPMSPSPIPGQGPVFPEIPTTEEIPTIEPTPETIPPASEIPETPSAP